MLELLPFIAFVIVNASLPSQSIPIDVQITPVLPEGSGSEAIVSSSSEAATAEGSQAATTGAAPGSGNIVIDAATITTLLGLAGGLFATWKKSKQVEVRTDAVADSTVNVKESLKATDVAAASNAEIIAQIATKLKNVKSVEEIPAALESCAANAQQNAQEWKEDIKEYYENKPPITSEDVGLDRTRAKLVEVNQQTRKTPEP